MSNRTLFVPIMMEALVIGKNSEKTADLAPDYSELEEIPLGKYTRRLFGTRPECPGVHLHWTMPDSLLHGVHTEKQGIVFPSLPNRWILQRICAKQGRIDRKAWIIESDFITNAPQKSITENPRTTIPTLELNENNGLWEGKGAKKQIYGYLGNSREYGTEQTEEGCYFPELTAVGAGDPTFAAFYPTSRTVFGFYDSMENVTEGTFTYVLTGYYDEDLKRDQDPLNNATKEVLDNLRWTYDDSEELPNKTVCHSMLKQVEWYGPDKEYPSGVPEGEIDVYIGNTSAETLSSIMQNKMPDVVGFERILNALQNNLLNDMENSGNPDALIEFEELLHEKQFSTEEHGDIWRLRYLKGDGEQPQLDDAVYQKIQTLNQLQDKIDLITNEMESIKNEIYFAWWKYVLIESDPWGNDELQFQRKHPEWYNDLKTAKNAEPNEFIALIKNFLSRLKKYQDEINEKNLQIELLRNEIKLHLDKCDMQLHNEKKERFYNSNPPVLMLSGDGVKRAYKQGYQNDIDDGLLYCRMSLITGINVTINNKNIPVSAKDAGGLCSPLVKELPDYIQKIFKESLLLSDDCAEAIAIKAYENAKAAYTQEQLNNTVAAIQKNLKNRKGFTGNMPAGLATGYWKQPWAPLLMQWRIQITPFRTNIKQDNSFSKFTLKEIDFEYNADEPIPTDVVPIEIQGATVISPHGVEHLSNMIHQLINDHAADGIDYENLKKAAGIIEKMDILSQRMDGFNEALVMRDRLPFLPIYYKPNTVGALLKDITRVLDDTYSSPRVDDSESRFLPVRSGFMKLTELWLVDSFGQIKKIKLSSEQSNEQLHIAENMQFNKEADKVFLRPRFMHPCTTLFKWICANNEEAGNAPLESVDNASTPVFGFVIPNFLDNNIQVYEASGLLLGFVQKSGTGAKWMKFFPSNVDVEQIASSHLKFFVKRLLGETNSALSDFLGYLNYILNKSAPVGNEQFLQLCFGKPLALARGSVQVMGRGYPPYVQWFKKELVCNGFDKEKFTVRFGDERKLFDGFIGLFVGDKKEETYKQLYVPQSFSRYTSGYLLQNNTIETTLTRGPTNMTFLMDPAGYITISTGFLPAKKITLNAMYYQNQLQNSEMMLRVSPILTQANNFEMPIPGGLEDEWSFTYIKPDKTTAVISDIQIPGILPSPIRQHILEGLIKTKLD